MAVIWVLVCIIQRLLQMKGVALRSSLRVLHIKLCHYILVEINNVYSESVELFFPWIEKGNEFVSTSKMRTPVAPRRAVELKSRLDLKPITTTMKKFLQFRLNSGLPKLESCKNCTREKPVMIISSKLFLFAGWSRLLDSFHSVQLPLWSFMIIVKEESSTSL